MPRSICTQNLTDHYFVNNITLIKFTNPSNRKDSMLFKLSFIQPMSSSFRLHHLLTGYTAVRHVNARPLCPAQLIVGINTTITTTTTIFSRIYPAYVYNLHKIAFSTQKRSVQLAPSYTPHWSCKRVSSFPPLNHSWNSDLSCDCSRWHGRGGGREKYCRVIKGVWNLTVHRHTRRRPLYLVTDIFWHS